VDQSEQHGLCSTAALSWPWPRSEANVDILILGQRLLEQGMNHVGLTDLRLRAKNVLWFVGILFTAFVASDGNLIAQHGQRSERIGFAKNDPMLVGRVALVVKSVILADDNPEVVGRVLHG